MDKTWIWILCVLTVFLLLTGTAVAETDWGKTGVYDSGRVRKIVQVTNGTYSSHTAYDDFPYALNPWSSDGDWIVYSSNISYNDHEICIVKPDGSGFQQLTANSTDDSNAQFTADGSGIVFERNEQSINIMDVGGTGETNLTAAHSGAYSENYPLISPDGTKIMYLSNTDIWVMDIDGTNNTKVSEFATVPPVGSFRSYCWSPDSTKVAFPSYFSGETAYKIITVGSDGNSTSKVGSDTVGLNEKIPSWSPDGSKIAYIAQSGATSYLIQIDNDGSNPETLVQEVNTTGVWGTIQKQISWSPDSKWVVYAKNERSTGYSTIFIVNRHTGEDIQLTNGYEDNWPIWSPDGRNILFHDSGYSTTRDSSGYADLLLLKLIPRYLSAVNFLLLY